MKVELVQDVVERIELFAIGRNSIGGRSDAKAGVVHSSSRPYASIPWGSRTDSAFPRTIKASLGDMNERRTAESSGFSKPAPDDLG